MTIQYYNTTLQSYEAIRLKFGNSIKLVSVNIVCRQIWGKYHFCQQKRSTKNGSEKQNILIIFLGKLWARHRGGNVEVIRETLKLSS